MIVLLIDLSVKATLLCLVAATVTALMTMRRASAASRHVVWTALFLAVLALPIARVLLPGLPVFVLAPEVLQVTAPALPAATPPTPVATPPTIDAHTPAMAPPSSVQVTPVWLNPPTAPVVVAEPAPRATLAVRDVVVPLWLSGVLLLFARAAVGRIRVRQLDRSASAVKAAAVLARVDELRQVFGVRRQIVVRTSGDRMPMTWGVRRPVILVPATALDADATGHDVLAPLLVHEVAHIARFDAVSEALARLAVALGWFNPLLWFAARQARLERERACDDAVLTRGAGLKASDYANQLLVLAQTARPALADGSHTLAMARRSQLELRVRSILDARTNRRATSRVSRLVAAALVLVAVPVAAVRLAARTVILEPVQTSVPIEQPALQAPAPPLAALPAPVRERAVPRPAALPQALADASSLLSGPPQATAPPPARAAQSQAAPSPHYVLGVGDLLTITVAQAPDLSGDVRVGVDGRIALARGNRVPAAGWTLEGFKAALTAELKRCCPPNPDVIVQVKEVMSRAFFFFNQDVQAGTLAHTSIFSRSYDWNALWRPLSFRELEAEKKVATRIQIGTTQPIDPLEMRRARQALDSLAGSSHQPLDFELIALRGRFADAVYNLDVVEIRFDNGLASVQALADAYIAAAETLKEPPQHWFFTGPRIAPRFDAPPPKTEYRLDAVSPLTDAELTSALKNAAIMSPDKGRADMLLALARVYAFTPDMVGLYVAAANGMASEAERARVFAQPIRVK